MPKLEKQKLKTASSPKMVDIVPGVQITYNEEGGPLVPESHDFMDNHNLLSTLSYAIEANLPVLLIGETGTGKTSAVRYLAKQTNNEFRRLNLNGQTTVDEFVGKVLINEKGTYWVDGILIDAMRKGQWLVLDELNAALPEVLFVLQSLLDDDRYVVLADKDDKEIVRPHPNFRIFGTQNPSDGYSGTKEMNKAFLSRFPLVLSVDYPERDQEIEIIMKRTGTDKADAEAIVDFARDQRKMHKDHEADFILSTRDLIAWASNNKFFKNWQLSAQMSFLNKCNHDDRDAIEKILKLNFKTTSGRVQSESDIRAGLVLRIEENISPYKVSDQVLPAGSEVTVLRLHTIDTDLVVVSRITKSNGQGTILGPAGQPLGVVMKGAQLSFAIDSIVGKASIITS